MECPEMNNDEEEEQYRISPCLVYFALVWMALGMWAFVRSLYCFGRSGSTTDKVVGLLVAWVFGPFYFIYADANKNYCRAV